MAKKSNIRSIRFSDDVLEIIEAQEGETFTAKFESLIRKCHQDLPQKERELTQIQKHINYEWQRLTNTQKMINEVQNATLRMESNLRYWNIQASNAAKQLEKLIGDQ